MTPLRLLTLLVIAWASAGAWPDMAADEALAGARLEQKIGARLPMALTFRDEADRAVSLDTYFRDKPVIVAPVWYSCPNLCNATLNGLVKGLKELDFRVGEDFQVVAVSIDPRDGVEQAAALKTDLMRQYGDARTSNGWHLLTGSEDNIRQFTDRLGFGYRYDPATGQYAHPATLALASADGQVTRYLPGIAFPAPDLRLALLEAGRGELGSVVDQVLLRCFSYDPETGQYTVAIVNVLRVLGSLTVVGVALAVVFALRRERRRRQP